MSEFNPDKKGGVIVLIGKTGTGKTPVIKDLISKYTPKNVVVYDPRHEYREEFTLFHRFETFKQFTNEIKNSFIIVEEATSVISFYKDSDLTEWMIASEHNNNIVFFVFHSLLDTPVFILRNCKFVILFDTGDDEKFVKSQRPKFYQYLRAKKPVFIENNL